MIHKSIYDHKFISCNIRHKTKTKIYLCLQIFLFLFFVYSVIHVIKINTTYLSKTLPFADIARSTNVNLVRQISSKSLKPKYRYVNCSIPKLKNHYDVMSGEASGKEQVAKCKRVHPAPNSCAIANAIFHEQPKGTCLHQKPNIVCQFKNKDLVCESDKCENIWLGIRSVKTGELSWKEIESIAVLDTNIRSLLNKENIGYCYIKCDIEGSFEVNDDYFYETNGLENTQLLIFPLHMKENKKKITKPYVNINLVFVDSVSRPHFYRSLPETIKIFEEINAKNDAVVLDFELLQAIRSRTFEVLNSLFAGYVPQNENVFGTLDMPPEPLKIEGLFSLFRDAGYDTLWLEDLCFRWEWGISKDLLVHNKNLSVEETWSKLWKAFTNAGINSFGISTANCEILKRNNVNDHFHGPETVCFNGRHQHEYMLEYLQLYQGGMASINKPYLSLFETNVGHEDDGTRIQTLDKDLVKYLQFAVKQNETLTIVFADHGNAYGKFFEKSAEARIELFQPALFMIIPKMVANYLGHVKMKALTMNQNRLISHLDLHYALRSIVSKSPNIPKKNNKYLVTNEGLFNDISLKRKCSNVPQIPPNFCICEGGESRMKNNSVNVIFAHFAVGSLNNIIQSQYHTEKQHVSGFGRCTRLKLIGFQNIWKTVNSENTMTMTFELLFNSADPHVQNPEVIVVTVRSSKDGTKLQLYKFDRQTAYSKYSVCADKGVGLQLCICDVTAFHEVSKITHASNSVFNITNDLLMHVNSKVIESPRNCLWRVVQQNEKGMSVFVTNTCADVLAHITMDVTVVSLVMSDDPHFQFSLAPTEIRFLFVAFIADKRWEWSFETEISFSKWL